MLRFLLILLLLYFMGRFVMILIRRAQYRAQHGKPQEKTGLFNHVEDAEFKDVTNEPPEKQ